MTLTLAERRTGLGASEMGAILGLSPHASRWSVFLEKTGQAEDSDSMEMRAGRYIEDAIRRWWQDETGLHVHSCPTQRHPRKPFLFASPDGLYCNGAHRVSGVCTNPAAGCLEIKNVGIGMRSHWGDEPGEIPLHTIVQVQIQMACLNLPEARFGVLFGGNQLRTGYYLQRDDELIASLEEEAERFWVDHVLTGTPPPPDGSEVVKIYLRKRFPQGSGILGVADDDASRWAEVSLTQRAAVKQAEKLRDEADQRLMVLIGEQEGLVGPGWKATWKTPEKGSLAWGKAIEEYILLAANLQKLIIALTDGSVTPEAAQAQIAMLDFGILARHQNPPARTFRIIGK